MINKYKEIKSIRKDDLYVTAGEKLYIIGSQDGLFPYFGRHNIEEMGGVWAHPIKLLDGYWLKIKTDNIDKWLSCANNIIVEPIYNTFEYKEKDLYITRTEFVPLNKAGYYLDYIIQNNSNKDIDIEIEFLARTELLPAWLSEKINIYDDYDELEFCYKENIFIGKDKSNPYYVIWGCDKKIDNVEIGKDIFGAEKTKGKGISGVIKHKFTLKKQEKYSIQFCFAGSCNNLEEAKNCYNSLFGNKEKYLKEKELYYNNCLSMSKIDIPNKNIEKLYDITKINTQWLVRDIDNMGRAICAGLPDYPWIFGCDNGYSVLALLTMGEFELCKSTLRILKEYSEKENGNGRIIHEVATNGVVSNKGNTQETPHFINAVWEVYEWTKDIEFLKEMYPICKKGLDWVLNEMDSDKDLFPEGYGIMEIAGLNAELIDTAVYTAQSFKSVSLMASIFNEKDIEEKYINLHKKAVDSIENRFWLEEEGLYADVISTPEKVKEAFPIFKERHDIIIGGEYNHRMAKLDRLYDNLDNYEKGKEYAFSIFKNWVILTPLEMGFTKKDRAISILDIMSSTEFVGENGLYIEALGRNFPMTISTAVLAVCEAKYGRIENCLKYMDILYKTMNRCMPMSLSEISPDKGCFVQEWTIYGTVYPIVKYVFGINPNAINNEIVLNPNMPKEWNSCKIENVKIFNGSISIYFERKNDEEIYTIFANNINCNIKLKENLKNKKIVFI